MSALSARCQRREKGERQEVMTSQEKLKTALVLIEGAEKSVRELRRIIEQLMLAKVEEMPTSEKLQYELQVIQVTASARKMHETLMHFADDTELL